MPSFVRLHTTLGNDANRPRFVLFWFLVRNKFYVTSKNKVVDLEKTNDDN